MNAVGTRGGRSRKNLKDAQAVAVAGAFAMVIEGAVEGHYPTKKLDNCSLRFRLLVPSATTSIALAKRDNVRYRRSLGQSDRLQQID